MSDQVWRVPVSPAQRFILVNLAHDEGQKVKGQRSRVYRRFLRAFGLTPILEAADDHKGQVNGARRLDRKPALFTLTSENIEYALGLCEIDRVTAVDRTIGPLFDALEDCKPGAPEPARGLALTGEVDVPDYDPASEDWAPQIETPVEDRIASYLRAKGEARAAVLVEQGDWDQPANGAAHAPPDEPRASS